MINIHAHKQMVISRAASVTLLLVFTFSLCTAASDRFKTRLDVKSDRIEFKLVHDSLQGTLKVSAGDSIQSFIFFQVKLQGGEKIPADRDSVLVEEGTVPVICTLPVSKWQCSDSIEIFTFKGKDKPHTETRKLKIIWPEADIKYFANWHILGFQFKKDSMIAQLRVTPINECGKPLVIVAQVRSTILKVFPDKILGVFDISITIPPEQTTFEVLRLAFYLGKDSASTNISISNSSEESGFPILWVVIVALVVAIILIGVFFQKVKEFTQAWPMVLPAVVLVAVLVAIVVYGEEIPTFIKTSIMTLIQDDETWILIGFIIIVAGLIILAFWQEIASIRLPWQKIRHTWPFRGKQAMINIPMDKVAVVESSESRDELTWKTSNIDEIRETTIHFNYKGPVGVSIECDQQIRGWYSIFAGDEPEPIKSFPHSVPSSGSDDNQTLTLKFQINKDQLDKREECLHRVTFICRWPGGNKEIRLCLSYSPDMSPAPPVEKEQEVVKKSVDKKIEPALKPDGSLDEILHVFQNLLDNPQRLLSLDNPALWEKMYIEPLQRYGNIDAKLIGIRNAQEIAHQDFPSLIVSEERKDGSFILVSEKFGMKEGYVFLLPYWLYKGETNLRLLDIFYYRPDNEGDGYIVKIESPAKVESRGDNIWTIRARGKVKFGRLGDRSKGTADVGTITKPSRTEPITEMKTGLSEEQVEAMMKQQLDRFEKHIKEIMIDEIERRKPDLSSMVKPITDIADEILKKKLGNIEKSQTAVREEIKEIKMLTAKISKPEESSKRYAVRDDVDKISGRVKRIEDSLDESQPDSIPKRLGDIINRMGGLETAIEGLAKKETVSQQNEIGGVKLKPAEVYGADNKKRLTKQIQDESLTQEMPDRGETILTFCNERLYEGSPEPAGIIEELRLKFDVTSKLLDKVPGEQTVLKSSERGNFLGILPGKDKAQWMIIPLQSKWTDPPGRGKIRGIYNEESTGKIAKVEKYAVAEEKDGGDLEVIDQGVLVYMS